MEVIGTSNVSRSCLLSTNNRHHTIEKMDADEELLRTSLVCLQIFRNRQKDQINCVVAT